MWSGLLGESIQQQTLQHLKEPLCIQVEQLSSHFEMQAIIKPKAEQEVTIDGLSKS